VTPRKNRPVLYELVARTQRARPAGPPRSPTPAPAPAASRPVATTPGAAPSATAAEESAPPRRSVRIVNGRVQLTLGWPELAIAGVLLAVILVALFQAGAQSARPAAPQAADADTLFGETPPAPAGEHAVEVPPDHRPRAGAGAPAPLGLGSGGEKPGAGEPQGQKAAGPPAEPAGLERGRYYVYVQYFKKDKLSEAQDARDFLHGKGVACVLSPTRLDLVLIAAEPFASETDAQGKELAGRIRELGKAYRKAGGGYDFKDCQLKKY